MSKTIGIIGGLSPESTISYYKGIVSLSKEAFGGHTTPDILIHSVNQQEFIDWKHEDRWDLCGEKLASAASGLEKNGAELVLLATNTMHRVAEDIENAISVPFVHIADATAEAITSQDCSKPLLLGTSFTMELPFYKTRIAEKYGLDVIVPEQQDRDLINTVIFDELCYGTITETSRDAFLSIINTIHQSQNIDSVILGCTEIGLLIQQQDIPVPAFDTADIHYRAAFEKLYANELLAKTG